MEAHPIKFRLAKFHRVTKSSYYMITKVHYARHQTFYLCHNNLTIIVMLISVLRCLGDVMVYLVRKGLIQPKNEIGVKLACTFLCLHELCKFKASFVTMPLDVAVRHTDIFTAELFAVQFSRPLKLTQNIPRGSKRLSFILIFSLIFSNKC
jgi:hypothetical protein